MNQNVLWISELLDWTEDAFPELMNLRGTPAFFIKINQNKKTSPTQIIWSAHKNIHKKEH